MTSVRQESVHRVPPRPTRKEYDTEVSDTIETFCTPPRRVRRFCRNYWFSGWFASRLLDHMKWKETDVSLEQSDAHTSGNVAVLFFCKAQDQMKHRAPALPFDNFGCWNRGWKAEEEKSGQTRQGMWQGKPLAVKNATAFRCKCDWRCFYRYLLVLVIHSRSFRYDCVRRLIAHTT